MNWTEVHPGYYVKHQDGHLLQVCSRPDGWGWAVGPRHWGLELTFDRAKQAAEAVTN